MLAHLSRRLRAARTQINDPDCSVVSVQPVSGLSIDLWDVTGADHGTGHGSYSHARPRCLLSRLFHPGDDPQKSDVVLQREALPLLRICPGR